MSSYVRKKEFKRKEKTRKTEKNREKQKRRRKRIPPSGIRIQIFRLKAPTMNEKDILVKCQNCKETESSKSFPKDKTS